jgi:hypothetical protein
MFTMDLGAPGKRLPKSILIRRDRSGAAGGLAGTAPAFPGVLWHDRRLAPDSFWREGHSGGSPIAPHRRLSVLISKS